MVERARLESVYTLIAYRGFESLSLRQSLFFSMTTIDRDTEGRKIFDPGRAGCQLIQSRNSSCLATRPDISGLNQTKINT